VQVTAPWRRGLPFNAPKCNCLALTVNDPGLIDDDNIRREPVGFIIDKPPAIIPIGRHSHAGPEYRWLRVCQLLPRLHFADLQVALGRMGGSETDDLAVANVHRDINFARLGELVLAVLFDVVAEKPTTILVLLLLLCLSPLPMLRLCRLT
jgi:hypothetical protein